jgi:uncharacterized protein
MEYFVYGRDRPGLGTRRWDLTEDHWSFMDRYADALIARGPTFLDDDEDAVTGSMHIVDVPDAAAARTFAFSEPYFEGGVFEDVLVRRWSNTLGRTMWDFAGHDGPRFLVIGHAVPGAGSRQDAVHEEQRAYLLDADVRDDVILCGPLLTDDGADWLGTALLLEATGRDAARTIVTNTPLARAGLYRDVEIHSWRFGGRPTE